MKGDRVWKECSLFEIRGNSGKILVYPELASFLLDLHALLFRHDNYEVRGSPVVLYAKRYPLGRRGLSDQRGCDSD